VPPALAVGRAPPDARPFAVIAGGGTGGHVIPALAIGRALVDRGLPAASLHFVGSERGIEWRLVPEAGFSLTVLPGRGIQRRLTAENLPAAWGLARAAGEAVALLRRLRPRVVVAVGGYASVPCALAAATLGLPIVVQEQNAVAGLANRITSRVARASAVAFPGSDLRRAVVTGNPVRPEVLAVSRSDGDRAAARSALGLPEGRRVVGVFGGSLGALRINRAVLEAVGGPWAGRSDLAVHHVVGERDWSLVSASVPDLPHGGLWYRPVRYEERLPLLMSAADLCVSRSGGNSVAELAVLGTPSVLVPLPGAPGDHQTANARILADEGGAVLVADPEMDGARLAAEVDGLVGDDGRLSAMGAAAARLGRRDAADRIAALVEEHAAGG